MAEAQSAYFSLRGTVDWCAAAHHLSPVVQFAYRACRTLPCPAPPPTGICHRPPRASGAHNRGISRRLTNHKRPSLSTLFKNDAIIYEQPFCSTWARITVLHLEEQGVSHTTVYQARNSRESIMSTTRIPVGRRMSRKQSDAQPPEMKMVSVAVLPPRLPKGMAPPTGVGVSGAMSWDEAVNWQHNEPTKAEEAGKGKQFMRKVGLTTQRARKDPDLPPFTFRQVAYDVWRMHYAKDADGNYRGTHAPAEDCLLKPDDVRKWRFEEEPQTQADKWTRGTEVLPVYSEVEGRGRLPGYEFEYFAVPPGEPTVDENAAQAPPLESHRPSEDVRTGKVIAGGKTAQEIIDEAKAKKAAKPKQSWRDSIKKGAEWAMMGAN